MKKLAIAIMAVFLLFGSMTLAAQGTASMQSAYTAWLGGTTGAQHFYLSGSVVGIDRGTAMVRLGVGGQMWSYTLSVQSVNRAALPGGAVTYTPIGAAEIYTRDHNVSGSAEGIFNESMVTVSMAPGANAVIVKLVPVAGFTDDATSFRLLLDGTVAASQQISQGGVSWGVAMRGPCPKGTKLVTGGCGDRCSLSACCSGSPLLDCSNCTLSCL